MCQTSTEERACANRLGELVGDARVPGSSFGLGFGICGSATTRAASLDGFHMREEAKPHERTFMQWPVGREVHPDQRFVKPGQLVVQLPEAPDPEGPWSAPACETYEILKAFTNTVGRLLEILALPEPCDTRVTSPGFVASYVNFYVCNGR